MTDWNRRVGSSLCYLHAMGANRRLARFIQQPILRAITAQQSLLGSDTEQDSNSEASCNALF